MFSAMILALGFTFVCPAIGEDDERNYTSKSLKIAWTEKPPYAFTSQTTEDKFIGFIREAIWQYLVDCGEAIRFSELLWSPSLETVITNPAAGTPSSVSWKNPCITGDSGK